LATAGPADNRTSDRHATFPFIVISLERDFDDHAGRSVMTKRPVESAFRTKVMLHRGMFPFIRRGKLLKLTLE
jgi:hypothetical protein